VVPGATQQVFGATFSENSYLVDGFNTTDPMTGASATRFNFDAVEEASVLTGGLDAEFGFGTGGVLNVVTKSGGNRFSGTVDARYRDQRFNESGEHYDPDVNVSSNRILSATLGGPILRDRLWFFAAFENRFLEDTPVGAPETKAEKSNLFLGKLTWAINAANRLTLKYSTTPRTIEYAGVESYTTSEATSYIESSEPTSQLELNSVLSDSLLLTVGLGFNREFLRAWPMINDIETPPEFDMDAFLLFSNPGSVEDDDRHRDHHRAKLSYFASDALGSHQLDAGLEYHRLRGRTVWFTPGGDVIFYFNNAYWEEEPWPDGDGDGLVDFGLERDFPPETARDPLVGDGDGWSAFVQDQWRPVPQLTLRLGLRYDTMAHTNTVGQTVADFKKWLPRVGVAWDVGGQSRHVLRAAWSRFMHPGVTNTALLVPGVTRGFEVYRGLDFLCGARGICDREIAAELVGPEIVHVDSDGDEHPFYLVYITEELPAETVDTLGVGRLQVPYRDELILAYEARVAQETSIELSYVRKTFRDRIEDTCNNNAWAWGDGDPPRLDDPSTWTDEAGCTGSVRANIDGLERGYEALILRAASRARSWFHLLGSYTYSKTRGNSDFSQPYSGFGSGFYAFPGSEFDYYPTNFINGKGNLDDDFRHFIKLNGYLQFPLDFTLGIGAFYRSAGALSVAADCVDMFFPSESGLTELQRLGIDYDEMLGYCQSPDSGSLLLEPQGSRRGADLWQLDLQLSKGFRIGNVRLVAIASVFNAFSNEAPTGFIQDPFDHRGWGTPESWQDPRRWEVGLRVEF
jgi:outer membrane receptor protein involved in Fe transport